MPHPGASDETYEVFAVQYAARQSRKAAEYYWFALYGEDDEPYSVSYYFWLARSAHRTILIDSGYGAERSKRQGVFQQNEPNDDPVELLSLLDVHPTDIDHVIVSHMHRDHAGNLDRFPNATVSMARAEYEFCTGPTARKAIPASVFEPEEVAIVQELMRNEQLHLVDHTESLLPGVEVTTVGGHAPGMLITDIASRDGSVVIASDALHFYEQLEHERPVWFFHNLEDLYRGYQTVRELATRPRTNIAPGHDPRAMSKFEPVVDGRIVDLTSPIDDERAEPSTR